MRKGANDGPYQTVSCWASSRISGGSTPYGRRGVSRTGTGDWGLGLGEGLHRAGQVAHRTCCKASEAHVLEPSVQEVTQIEEDLKSIRVFFLDWIGNWSYDDGLVCMEAKKRIGLQKQP